MTTEKIIDIAYARLRMGYDVKVGFTPGDITSEERLTVTDAAAEAFTRLSFSTLCAGNVRIEPREDGCASVVVRVFVAEENASGVSSEVDFTRSFRHFRDTVLPKLFDALPGKYCG
jgi:hypothetical protein